MTDTENQDQAEKLLVSIKDLNNLMMANVQRLMKMNIDLVENYTQIGLDNYKSATSIKSVDELVEYAQKQSDIAQDVGRKITEDAKTVIEMSNQYLAGSRRVAEDSLASFMPFSAQNMTIFQKNTDLLMHMFRPTHGTAAQATSQDDKTPEDVQ